MAARRKRTRQSHFWCNDPLNLKEITVQASTPKSSPLPTPKYKQEVEILIPGNFWYICYFFARYAFNWINLSFVYFLTILIHSVLTLFFCFFFVSLSLSSHPANIRDPLNLTGQVVSGSLSELASPLKVHRSRAKRKKRRKGPSEAQDLNASVDKVTQTVEKQGDVNESTATKSSTELNQAKESSTNSRFNRFQRPNTAGVRKSNRKRVFKYGNFDRYYGYRNAGTEDTRLSHFKSEWFEGRDVLDIGCNNGSVTLAILQKFKPRTLKGIDIDVKLIGCARQSLESIVSNDECTQQSDASSSNASAINSRVTFVAGKKHCYCYYYYS